MIVKKKNTQQRARVSTPRAAHAPEADLTVHLLVVARPGQLNLCSPNDSRVGQLGNYTWSVQIRHIHLDMTRCTTAAFSEGGIMLQPAVSMRPAGQGLGHHRATSTHRNEQATPPFRRFEMSEKHTRHHAWDSAQP